MSFPGFISVYGFFRFLPQQKVGAGVSQSSFFFADFYKFKCQNVEEKSAKNLRKNGRKNLRNKKLRKNGRKNLRTKNLRKNGRKNLRTKHLRKNGCKNLRTKNLRTKNLRKKQVWTFLLSGNGSQKKKTQKKSAPNLRKTPAPTKENEQLIL